MTNDSLAALILPWAKEHHPEGYAKTVASAAWGYNPYRLRLLRLVEIRCEREPAWRNSGVPLSVLDETSVHFKAKHLPSERTLIVGGKSAPPGTNDLRFSDLTWLSAEDMDAVLTVIEEFKTERV